MLTFSTVSCKYKTCDELKIFSDELISNSGKDYQNCYQQNSNNNNNKQRWSNIYLQVICELSITRATLTLRHPFHYYHDEIAGLNTEFEGRFPEFSQDLHRLEYAIAQVIEIVSLVYLASS